MKNCKKFNDLLPGALYNELNNQEKAWFRNHLKECEACKLQFDRYKVTLRIMDKKQEKKLSQEYSDSYWDRLLDKIETHEKDIMPSTPKDKKIKMILPSLPSWSYKMGFALGILIIGIFLGRTFFSPSVESIKDIKNTSEKYGSMAALETRTQRFLEKSKILLLGIINYDPDTDEISSFNFDRNREVSQHLVQGIHSLKHDLDQASQTKLSRLISELELILLQIANLESEEDMEQIEMIQSGVQQKSILMKITVNEMEKGYDLEADTKKQKQKTI